MNMHIQESGNGFIVIEGSYGPGLDRMTYFPQRTWVAETKEKLGKIVAYLAPLSKEQVDSIIEKPLSYEKELLGMNHHRYDETEEIAMEPRT